MELEIDNDTKKMRILNYLDYMDDKSLQEISVALYNLAMKRREINNKKQIFQGWMISSSPSTVPFEHPIYDVWLKDCIIK